MFDFRVPKSWGTNGEKTNFSLLFRLQASLGHPGSPPGGDRNGPKTSPKSLRDPLGLQFFTIFAQFLMHFFKKSCRFAASQSVSQPASHSATQSRHGGGKAEGEWIACFLLCTQSGTAPALSPLELPHLRSPGSTLKSSHAK